MDSYVWTFHFDVVSGGEGRLRGRTMILARTSSRRLILKNNNEKETVQNIKQVKTNFSQGRKEEKMSSNLNFLSSPSPYPSEPQQ